MRQIKVGSKVQVTVDKDSGMLVGRKGTVTNISTSTNKIEYIWVKFDNHTISLPFAREEIKAVNRTKKK